MLRRLLLLTLTLLFSACSTLSVETDYDPDVTFETYQTFSIFLPDNSANSLNDERIRRALERHLKTKGYTIADSADFQVRFHTALKKNVPGNVSFGFGFGTFSRSSGASIGAHTRNSSDRSVLSVDFINPKTDKTLWYGSASDTLHSLKTPQEKEAYIFKIINTLLKTFPVRKQP